MYTFTVPVLEKTAEGDHVTSVRLEPLTIVLIICVVILSIIAVVLASIICRRRRAAVQRLIVVDEDRNSSAASLRTRLSPLRSNLLYSVTSDDEKVKSRESQGRLLVAEGPTRTNADSLGEFSALDETAIERLESVDSQKKQLFVEGHSEVMSGTVRRRFDGLTQSISEYEIPLDPKWEFPRDRSDCKYMSC